MAAATTQGGRALPGRAIERDEVLARSARHVNKGMASLARMIDAPVEVRSAGTRVYGDDGSEHLDCGGFGVFLLGHCHPRVVAAVRTQLEAHPLATRLFVNGTLADAAATTRGWQWPSRKTPKPPQSRCSRPSSP